MIFHPYLPTAPVSGFYRRILDGGIGFVHLFLGAELVLIAFTVQVALERLGAAKGGRVLTWSNIGILGPLVCSLFFFTRAMPFTPIS
jgi:hypothetical protein